MTKIKESYKKRVGKYTKHQKLSIIPAPNRVLIRITKQQIEDLISKVIIRDDGTKTKLFFESLHFAEGFDRRFQQNASVGEVIGVGDDVLGVMVGDVVILDYLVSNLSDDLVGYFKGNQLIAILAHTTYHKDSSPLFNGRRAWVKGDYDNISRILGVVRGEKLIPFDPYVFVEYKSDRLNILDSRGEYVRNDNAVIKREVVGAPDDCTYKSGDIIILKRDDWFDREINERKVAVCFKNDILCKV